MQLPAFQQLFSSATIFYYINSRTKSDRILSVHKHTSLVLHTQPSYPKLEGSKSSSDLEEVQEGGFRELQAGQPHLNTWKGDGENSPGRHILAHERQKGK